MATYVEAGRTGILIDPGATLAPSRFNLPPADVEWEALRRANDRVSAYAARSAVVFVSHYHEDHFRYDARLYAGRRVLARDPRRLLGGVQSRRAAELWTRIGDGARLEAADGREDQGPDCALRVSAPLPHGVDGTPLGYVVALTVEDRAEGFRFVFASDVQGPLSPVVAAYLIRVRPHLLYLSGPPSYLEKQLGAGAIDRGVDNLRRVMDATGCRVIMDHHALRDGNAADRFGPLWEDGRVVTAAHYLGVPVSALEGKRHILWAAQRKPPARITSGQARRSAPSPFSRRAQGGRRG
jgi:hypothetical protein